MRIHRYEEAEKGVSGRYLQVMRDITGDGSGSVHVDHVLGMVADEIPTKGPILNAI